MGLSEAIGRTMRDEVVERAGDGIDGGVGNGAVRRVDIRLGGEGSGVKVVKFEAEAIVVCIPRAAMRGRVDRRGGVAQLRRVVRRLAARLVVARKRDFGVRAGGGGGDGGMGNGEGEGRDGGEGGGRGGVGGGVAVPQRGIERLGQRLVVRLARDVGRRGGHRRRAVGARVARSLRARARGRRRRRRGEVGREEGCRRLLAHGMGGGLLFARGAGAPQPAEGVLSHGDGGVGGEVGEAKGGGERW